MNLRFATLFLGAFLALASWPHAQGQASPAAPPSGKPPFDITTAFLPATEIFPLYGGDPIPNAKPSPDREVMSQLGMTRKVSLPTIQAYLPAPAKATGTSIVIFPGGGYEAVSLTHEGSEVATFFQDMGVAAFVVKYRLPSAETMVDRSIGPLQDAQQTIRFVRQHATKWKLDPSHVGVIGFSAGGHLAATLGTHFDKPYVRDAAPANLRPDFMILMYPVITTDPKIAHMGSVQALLGKDPSPEQLRLFSNETQVTAATPPTLILHAADDGLVDVDNSIVFFEALRHQRVPVEMTIFEKGDHGFFLMSRFEWESAVTNWMLRKGWLR